MIVRALAVLALLAPAASAQLQVVSQTRKITGDVRAGALQDSFSFAAPDAGPYQDWHQISVWPTSARAHARADQTSVLGVDRIHGECYDHADASADLPGITAAAQSESRIDVEFDVLETVTYSLVAALRESGGTADSSVRLEQAGSLLVDADVPIGMTERTLHAYGVLTPGRYRLLAVGTASHDSAIHASTRWCDLEFTFDVERIVGALYCFGDGSGTPCPCGNHTTSSRPEGCLNSLATGGKLRAEGTSSLSNDTVVLFGSQMPISMGLYFQGTTRRSGGAGALFGDGKLCAGGALARLSEKYNDLGSSRFPSPGDVSLSTRGAVTSPGTRTYQLWYRNAATFCTAATYNLTNGLELAWQP